MLKKTMMAMAGVTAGLSTAFIGGGAQAAEPSAPTIDYSLPHVADEVGILAMCSEATEYTNGGNRFYIPSIGRNDGRLGCTLVQGNYNNNAVFKLQDALRLCHGQAISSDGDFGPATAAALRNVTGSTSYNGNYRQINWPIYNSSGNFTGLCANV